MNRDDDFLHKLDLIFAYIKELLKVQQQGFSKQEELFALLQNLNERVPARNHIPTPVAVAHGSDWIDAYEVKAILHIGDMTLRRRRSEGAFISKKIGKKWFYLRSSLQ